MLMGIKQCHRCLMRTQCNRKNNPSNLLKTPKTFEKKSLSKSMPGRFRQKMPLPITLKIISYCKTFMLE